MDPLRQLMTMADDVRKNVDSMLTQGTRQIKTTLPQLPFPGIEGTSDFLPKGGPQEILGKLPKLPGLPGLPAGKAGNEATQKFLPGGPRVEVHPKEWHNSHTLAPEEILSLRSRLIKNGVPTSDIVPKVLSK